MNAFLDLPTTVVEFPPHLLPPPRDIFYVVRDGLLSLTLGPIEDLSDVEKRIAHELGVEMFLRGYSSKDDALRVAERLAEERPKERFFVDECQI